MGLRERAQEFLSLKGNLLYLATLEFVSNLGWTMFDVVWQPYVLSLGGTIPALGTLQSLRSTLMSVLELVMGRVSDSVGRRKPIILSYFLTLSGLIVVISARSWIWVVPALVIWAFADSIWDPVFPTIISESVEEDRRGTAFSLWSLTWSIPGFFMPALGGYFAQFYGYRPVFLVIFIGELAALLIFSRYVRETLSSPKELDTRSLLVSLREALRPKPGLARFYLAAISGHFAWALKAGILYAVLMETYGFNLIQIGILANVMMVMTTLSQIFFGKLVDRHGGRTFMILSRALWFTVHLGFLLSRDFTGFLLSQMLAGLASSAWVPSFYAYLTSSVSEHERARTYGDLSCLVGLISFPAPVLGALLYETYGFSALILACLALIVVSFISLLSIKSN